jgi:glycosyltransferase involved in cell wall biosynthesis
MKIVHLSTAYGWRGGEQQCFYLAKGLASRGIENVIVAQPDSPLHDKAKAFEIKTIPLKCGSEFDVGSFFRLKKILVEEKADIVHAHDGHAVTPAAIGGWMAGAKRVCTRRVDFKLRGAFKYKYGMDRVICISRAIKDICASAGVSKEKMPVVYSGVDPDRLRGNYTKKHLLKEFGFDRRDHILLNVASLTDHKGQCYLLDAMLEVARIDSRARLLIAGEGELEEQLKYQARELALDDKVFFLGFRKDIGELLHLCDLFVMSSHLEGLCTSVLDALANEKAVVITDAGGLPETIENAEGGEVGRVVTAKDSKALAKTICELLKDHKLREKMGIRGRRHVMEKFSFEKMTEGTLAVYNELLKNKGSL